MKTVTLTIGLILQVSVPAVADDLALPLHACSEYGGLKSVLETGTVDQAQVCLEGFSFSRNNVAEHARQVSLLCAKFLKLDESGDTDEACYHIYNKNPEAVGTAWQRLPTDDRARLQRSYRQTDRVYRHGNGG
jgi:hypothetical protein